MKQLATMLTIKQAAKVSSLAPFRIRRMCISGELPHIMAGKKYLINQDVLLRKIGIEAD